MVSVTKMSKQVPQKPVTTKKKMKKTQVKKAINEKHIDAAVDGGLEKAESDSKMNMKVAPEAVPKKKKMNKAQKKAINEENGGLEKEEVDSRNDNEQQLEDKEEDQVTPKEKVKAKKNKKKKMQKSLETAEEVVQENKVADEEGNDDEKQSGNAEAKPQNKKKRASDSQDPAENKEGVKANKKKKMKKSVNTAEKPLEEEKDADDEKDDVEEDKDEEPSAKVESEEAKEELERRTLFVGNVDIKVKRSALRKIFKEYGEVETVRFRNAAVADPNESKKVAMIKRHFHESQVSIIAYVRFKAEESAIAALSANNKILNGRHLQVDRASGNRKIDPKCSVFIGNLPFDANEEEVRDIFLDCGAIENVRIVRDKELGSGKGFGYVNFQSPDAVELALKMSGTPLRKRQLRVKRYLMKDQVEKRQKMMEKKTQINPKKMRLNFMAKNKQGGKKAATSFTGEKFKAKENIKKKKKFTKDEKKKFAISKKLSGSN